MSPIPKRPVAAGVSPAVAWTAPVVRSATTSAAGSAVPGATTAACNASLTLHPISCLLSSSPVQLELALTFTSDCTGGEGVTSFDLQNLFGQTGINATFEVSPGKPETQVFLINLGVPGTPQPTFNASGVIVYPDGTQAYRDYTFNTPQNRCCFTP